MPYKKSSTYTVDMVSKIDHNSSRPRDLTPSDRRKTWSEAIITPSGSYKSLCRTEASRRRSQCFRVTMSAAYPKWISRRGGLCCVRNIMVRGGRRSAHLACRRQVVRTPPWRDRGWLFRSGFQADRSHRRGQHLVALCTKGFHRTRRDLR
jgi:hypothetical protein